MPGKKNLLIRKLKEPKVCVTVFIGTWACTCATSSSSIACDELWLVRHLLQLIVYLNYVSSGGETWTSTGDTEHKVWTSTDETKHMVFDGRVMIMAVLRFQLDAWSQSIHAQKKYKVKVSCHHRNVPRLNLHAIYILHSFIK